MYKVPPVNAPTGGPLTSCTKLNAFAEIIVLTVQDPLGAPEVAAVTPVKAISLPITKPWLFAVTVITFPAPPLVCAEAVRLTNEIAELLKIPPRKI